VYHRKGDYSYHDFLVNAVADILFHKGLLPKIQAHGLPLADIMVEPKLAFEIETGSKNGYKIEETRQRVDGFEKEGYRVYIIVPNQEIKKKYAEAGFSNVFTLLELKEVRL
jgi:competence CoiA-like predicted nuclease